MKRIHLIIALSFMLFGSACKKSVTDDDLPPATQTGANTFGAKVNGQAWIPQRFGAVPASNILEARFVGNDLIINARNFANSPNETEFEIRVIGATGPGNYSFNTNVTHPSFASSYAYYVKRNINPQNEWITSATSTGTVNITRLDPSARIVSGTFSFNALNIYNAPEPLSVTEGRFDVKY